MMTTLRLNYENKCSAMLTHLILILSIPSHPLSHSTRLFNSIHIKYRCNQITQYSLIHYAG